MMAIIYLEPDILEWTLGSITMNTTKGGDEIPTELFKILKDNAVTVLHSICLQIWKTQQWPQDWKRSGFIPVPKEGSAKECSNYTVAIISHVSKVIFKLLQARLQQYVTWELLDVQAGFRKGRETRDQIANILWTLEKATEFQKNIYFCFNDYTKSFACLDNSILWKFLKKWKYQTTLPASWETCMQDKKHQSELNMEQQTGSKLGKEYLKAEYCHCSCLTYLQSTLCEMPGWSSSWNLGCREIYQ